MMREIASNQMRADPIASSMPPIPGLGRRDAPPDPDEGRGAPGWAATEADRLLADIDRLLVSERQLGALHALVRVLRALKHASPVEVEATLQATLGTLRLGGEHVEVVLSSLDALADPARRDDGGDGRGR